MTPYVIIQIIIKIEIVVKSNIIMIICEQVQRVTKQAVVEEVALLRFYISSITIVIIITRPKPAYGWQGLWGSWGQDTDEVNTFWGVLNVSLRTSSAQLGFKPTWNH